MTELWTGDKQFAMGINLGNLKTLADLSADLSDKWAKKKGVPKDIEQWVHVS